MTSLLRDGNGPLLRDRNSWTCAMATSCSSSSSKSGKKEITSLKMEGSVELSSSKSFTMSDNLGRWCVQGKATSFKHLMNLPGELHSRINDKNMESVLIGSVGYVCTQRGSYPRAERSVENQRQCSGAERKRNTTSWKSCSWAIYLTPLVTDE